jgi:hypothetical protein
VKVYWTPSEGVEEELYPTYNALLKERRMEAGRTVE